MSEGHLIPQPDDAPPDAVTRARIALNTPPQASNAGLWFLISMALFVLAGSDNKVFDLVTLAVIILIHEAGHALAMKMFSYRDVRVFFIPFFGGAASGKKTGAPVWQQAVVLLAGPLPGIGIGAVLAIVGGIKGDQQLLQIALMFMLINGFNLLPFPPLDGGRLVEIAIFARHRVLEMLFATLSAIALIGLAIGLRSVGLGILAFFALIVIPYRTRLRRYVDELRARFGVMPNDSTQLTDVHLEALDAAAIAMHPEPHITSRPASIRVLWERLAEPPPSVLTSVAIIGAWFTSLIGLLVAFMIYAVAHGPPKEVKPPDPAAPAVSAPEKAG